MIRGEEGIKDQFGQFLENKCAEDVVSFARENPTQRYFEVSWQAVQSFDEQLATAIRTDIDALRPDLINALRQTDCIDRQVLTAPRLIFVDGPPPVHVSDLRAHHAGNIESVYGRLTDVSDVKQILDLAAFECGACGNMTYSQREGFDDPSEPYECHECNRVRVDHDIDDSESYFVDYREAVLEDVQYPKGRRETIEIEVIGPAAADVSSGDWVEVTGTITIRLRGDGTMIGDHAGLVWDVTPVSKAEVEVHDRASVPDLFDLPDVKFDREMLSGYVEHADRLIGTTVYRSDMVEEEAKTKLISPLLELLGWDLYSNEVRLEYENERAKKLDYALIPTDSSDVDGHDSRRQENPTVCVEAKSPGTLTAADRKQIKRYMQMELIEWGLLSDGHKFELFHGGANPALVFSTEYELLPEYTAELSSLHREQFSDQD